MHDRDSFTGFETVVQTRWLRDTECEALLKSAQVGVVAIGLPILVIALILDGGRNPLVTLCVFTIPQSFLWLVFGLMDESAISSGRHHSCTTEIHHHYQTKDFYSASQTEEYVDDRLRRVTKTIKVSK